MESTRPPTVREVVEGETCHRGIHHLRDAHPRASELPWDLAQEREMEEQLAPPTARVTNPVMQVADVRFTGTVEQVSVLPTNLFFRSQLRNCSWFIDQMPLTPRQATAAAAGLNLNKGARPDGLCSMFYSRENKLRW